MEWDRHAHARVMSGWTCKYSSASDGTESEQVK